MSDSENASERSSLYRINKDITLLGITMKIVQLLEFVEEDFKSMSQKATNIQQGKGAVDNTQLRQQRISQLSKAQAARNANPAGRPMNTAQPAATQAAPAQAAPAQTAAPATTGQAAAPAKPSIGQRIAGAVKGVSKAVGAVGGGAVGAAQELKKGYQAGKAAVTGQGAPASEPAAAAQAAPVSAATGGQAAPSQASGGGTQQAAPAAKSGNMIAQLQSRVDALEKAVGIAEEFKFESKFLGMKI